MFSLPPVASSERQGGPAGPPYHVAGRAALPRSPIFCLPPITFHRYTSSMSDTPFREPGRRTPAKGVHVTLGGPNWVFLSVCTEKRGRWLAQASIQRAHCTTSG